MKVGELEFKTNRALKEYTVKTLNEIGRFCCSIKVEHPQHFLFLIALIQRHPDPTKANDIIDMTTVAIDSWRWPTVSLMKPAGTENVSLVKKCVSGRDTTAHGKRLIEFRESIHPQILAFRDTAKRVCVFCGETSNLHVDHVYPFSRLVAENTGDFIEYHRQNAAFQMLCAACNGKKSDSLNIPAFF